MKPILAATTNGVNLTYPLIVSPKLDGIRALIIGGKVVSRSLKPIPNKYIQMIFGNKKKLNGLDGELIVGSPEDPKCFTKTSSGVMSLDGKPDISFHVFDDFSRPYKPFKDRLSSVIERTKGHAGVIPVFHTTVNNPTELEIVENKFVSAGFEGIMLRDPLGQYKYGRSTLSQQWLLKLKRFMDSEAIITTVHPLMHNSNIAVVNNIGNKERSSKKSGMIETEMLGSISVIDVKTGVDFDIGSGFTEAERKELWGMRGGLTGLVVKYKYQPAGVKDKPRFPVFIGFRNSIDQ